MPASAYPPTDLSQLPDGWEPCSGVGCPVPADSKPSVMLRSGTTISAGSVTAASLEVFWRHKGESGDIIAYKI